MKLFAVAMFVALAVLASASVCRSELLSEQDAYASKFELIGQLLLPSGYGSRGVEVVATVADAGGDPRDIWILFDGEGRISETVKGHLIRIVVSTGLRAELHRIEEEELPEANQLSRIDLGVVDLRDRLVTHRLTLRAAEGASQGDVRVAMCFGLPPVGPRGEPVSLGSRQFPPIALGSEVDWLLPREIEALYFLVERPVSTEFGTEWRGGHQRLFGPFTSTNLPAELTMD